MTAGSEKRIGEQAARALTTPERVVAEATRQDATTGEGQATGTPALGRHDGSSYSPTGGPGINHWQEARIESANLHERGNIFFAAVEMTRMPMIVTDPNGPDNPVVFANRAFQDLTGYTQDEILGRNCRFLQGALTDRGMVAQIRAAVAEGRPFSTEILNYRKDGTTFWNALFVAPILNQDGRLLYYFASQLDVTRRRNSEDAFRQAQKMEAVGQLTAGLAHDFNNTLQVVIGNIARAVETLPADSAAQRALSNAERAARQAAKLTGQLLAFARKTRLEPRRLVLNQVLLEFGEMLSRSLGTDIQIRYDLDPALPACVVDPVHLEMALLNVLANARDAMEPGGRATVRTEALVLDEAAASGGALRPGRYVGVSVVDEGPGMPPEVLARSTEPFFTTKPGKGTGLGLAMVHGFVRQSGGQLEITSEPGRGTSVRMLFPVAGRGAEAPPPAEAEPVFDAGGAGQTILAVDDDEDVLELTVHHLTALGYRVLAASSGEEALEVLRRVEGRIDLLFSDVAMPGGMNGLVLVEQARARHPGLPVLLTTGYNEQMSGGTSPGGIPVLGKPFQRTDLADRVRSVLNQQGGGASAQPPHEG